MHIETAEAIAVPTREQRDMELTYSRLRKSRADLVGADGKPQRLPHSLTAFLLQLLAELNNGKSVVIVNRQSELTTSEASTILGTSRQFLVNLLERGEIPYRKVGTHRRVLTLDLLEYKARRDYQRGKILDDLSRAEAEEGLYGLHAPECLDC